MKRKEIRKLSLGVYRIFWKSGGCSVASVGQLHNGDRWIAPANWTSEFPRTMGVVDYWKMIERVELIATE